MGNLIVVTGSPGSGKTCVAVKLAKELYQKEKQPVILLSPDLYVPIMPFLFPRKNQQVYSLGGCWSIPRSPPTTFSKPW